MAPSSHREVEDDLESSLDDHQRLNSILESQGKACRVHMEQDAWRSFQQLIKEEVNSGSVIVNTVIAVVITTVI